LLIFIYLFNKKQRVGTI